MIKGDLLRAGAISTTLAIIAGCGGSSERRTIFPCHIVKGVVQVDGKPAAGAKIVLYPVAPEINAELRPSATTGTDGGFAITSYKDGDGAPAGEYDVAIVWPSASSTPAKGGMQGEAEAKEQSDRLFGRYSDPSKSKLRRTVAAGENSWDPFKLTATGAREKPKRDEGE